MVRWETSFREKQAFCATTSSSNCPWQDRIEKEAHHQINRRSWSTPCQAAASTKRGRDHLYLRLPRTVRSPSSPAWSQGHRRSCDNHQHHPLLFCCGHKGERSMLLTRQPMSSEGPEEPGTKGRCTERRHPLSPAQVRDKLKCSWNRLRCFRYLLSSGE